MFPGQCLKVGGDGKQLSLLDRGHNLISKDTLGKPQMTDISSFFNSIAYPIIFLNTITSLVIKHTRGIIEKGSEVICNLIS